MKINTQTLLAKYGSVFALLVIVVIATLLRFWHLGTAPKGLLIDEASFGYIAKSIAETGKDEHGVSYPVVFEAFGDQKLPLQGYLLAPVVKIFGLNNTTVRSVSAIAGVLIVVAIYLLIASRFTSRWGLLAATITAVSPWTFYLSRFAWESNVALCLFIFGLYFLFRSIEKRSIVDASVMMVLWALTWYTYIAYRPITGILGLIYIIQVYRQHLFSSKKIFILCLFALIIVAPLFTANARGANTARLNQVGIHKNPGTVMKIDEKRAYCSSHTKTFWCSLAWNKPTEIINTFGERFMRAYSFDYLFAPIKGDVLFATEDNGEFVGVLAPFLYVGIGIALYNLFQRSKNPLSFWICVGMIVSVLPALYVSDMHRVRGSALFPFLVMCIAWGGHSILSHRTHRLMKSALLVVITCIFFVQTYIYLMNWFTVHVDQHDFTYDGQVPPLMQYLGKTSTDTQIYFKPFISDPILTYAYYTDFDPQQYQTLAKYGPKQDDGFQHAVKLGRVEVTDRSPRAIGCLMKSYTGPLLYVTDFDESQKPVFTVKSTNGVHTRAYVYDIRSFTPDTMCEK